MRIGALFGISAALLVTLAPAHAQTPGAGIPLRVLLDRHLAALGGKPALLAMKNIRIVSKLTTAGTEGTSITVHTEPDKEYSQTSLGSVSTRCGYDGKEGWIVDSDGRERRMRQDELRDLKSRFRLDISSGAPEPTLKNHMALRAERDPSTLDYVVDASPEGGNPLTVYFNPTTYLIDRIVCNAITSTYSDYRLVHGVLIAMRTHETNGVARYDTDSTVERVDVNTRLPKDFFAAPRSRKTYVFLPDKNDHGRSRRSAAVSFELNHGRIEFTALIEGHSERLIFDSGASGLVLTDTAASALKLKQSGKFEQDGYGGKVDGANARVRSLEIPGAIRLTDLSAAVMPLPDAIVNPYGKPIAGIIGYDVLAQMVVRLDFQRQTLTFIDPATFRPVASDGQPCPVTFFNNIPSIPGNLGNLPAGRFNIDTGDSGLLTVYQPYVAAHRLTGKYPYLGSIVSTGVAGAVTTSLATVDRFSLSGWNFLELPVLMAVDANGSPSGSDGSLGTSLLSQYRMTFDYPHDRIFMAPVADAMIDPNGHRPGVFHAGVAPAPKPVAVVPFQYDPVRSPHITIDVRINGQPALPFAVDTNSAASLIVDTDAALKLNLPVAAGTSVLMLGVKAVALDAAIRQLQFAGLAPNDPALTTDVKQTLVADLSSFGKTRAGQQIAGTIGLPFFTGPFQYQFDFPARVIRIYSCSQNAVMGNDPRTDAIFFTPGPYNLTCIGSPLEDRHTISMWELDLGQYASTVHGLAALPFYSSLASKELKTSQDSTDFADTLCMPIMRFGDVVEPGVELTEANNPRNHIGLNVLSRFILTLDLTNNRAYLQRPPDHTKPRAPIDEAALPHDVTLGAQLRLSDGNLEITQVTPGSPADRAGLKADDNIVQLNGQPIAKLTPEQIARELGLRENYMLITRDDWIIPHVFHLKAAATPKPARQ